MLSFVTHDLETIQGAFDCACSLGVLIHYPPECLDSMVVNPATLSKERLILSFAPKRMVR